MWKRLVCTAPSTSTNHGEQQSTIRFSVLARERRFDELSEWLLSMQHPNDDECTFDVRLPLHYLLRYNPPVSLVNQLLLMPHSTTLLQPDHTDSNGRNALHLACWYNCHVSIIARLINYSSTTNHHLNIPDLRESRYPLHFLCLDYDVSLSQTALFVRDVFPQATLHRDVYGCTPTDILQQQRHQTVLQSPPPCAARTQPILDIPIPLQETVSDLTNPTAFYNNHVTTVSSLHSKSTCSTTSIITEEEDEQEWIVQAVRHKLLSQKPQVCGSRSNNGQRLPKPRRQRRDTTIDQADWESVHC